MPTGRSNAVALTSRVRTELASNLPRFHWFQPHSLQWLSYCCCKACQIAGGTSLRKKEGQREGEKVSGDLVFSLRHECCHLSLTMHHTHLP